MSATFKHTDLKIYDPDFGSNLTDLIINLDYLRKKILRGTTHPQIFFQLKHIFHMLESIGSARIEGNHTTIAEYIETKIKEPETANENIQEILNSEKAMQFIDENVLDTEINRAFLSEIHKTVVKNLTHEGSKTPGSYRKSNLEIVGSKHTPPDYSQIETYMNELLDFINDTHAEKYDLLKTAVAHHRFAWIHPYDNGNGRTVRLLTYAMLIKQGFNVNLGRIINPTAVFCNDRNKYYDALALADSGTKKGILIWCEYVLSGLKDEIEKIDRLLDYKYLHDKILLPTLSLARKRENITDQEERVLRVAIKKQVFMSSDIEDIFPGKAHTERSRALRKLKERNMIVPERNSARKYIIRFDNNYLLRSIIETLGKNDFLPLRD
jgi:Fic family protein